MASRDRTPNASLEVPPLASERTVIRIGAAGAGLAIVAAASGLIALADESLVSFRAVLSTLSMIVVGFTVSRRPKWSGSWLIAAGTCLVAGFGFSPVWDTFRLVAFVFSGVSVVGALLAALPTQWRWAAASVPILYHFSGIFIAVTAPPQTPDLSKYLKTVVFRHYLDFAYLNNAYQFYSPEPGPASELWFCIEYEPLPGDEIDTDPDGKPKQQLDGQPRYKKTTQWIKTPRRNHDFKDPLGQSYYRRLSLTENVSAAYSLTELPDNVQREIIARRKTVENKYPSDNSLMLQWQYRRPWDSTIELLLPSYVRHIASVNQRSDRAIIGIKVYRVMHRVMPPETFVGKKIDGKRKGVGPFDPSTYMPYYMGDFQPDGELRPESRHDPMLYWLVPILRNPDAKAEDFNKSSRDWTMSDYEKLYIDVVRVQAESNHMEGELAK